MIEYTFPELSRSDRTALHARIGAVGAALPEDVVSNEDIVSRYGHRVSPKSIEKILGVACRRTARKGVSDSDLLAAAALDCLNNSAVSADELSKIIVTRFMGDRLLPMTAAFVQHKLGCKNTVQAYDINGGTHSFLQALQTAAVAVEADRAPVLVVSGGIVNRLASRESPLTAFLYGDGAAAVLLVPSETPAFRGAYFFSNYNFADFDTAFRLQEYASSERHETRDFNDYFDICRPGDWKEIREFSLSASALTVRNLLSIENKTPADVDLWLVPETHGRLRDALVDHLGIPTEKTAFCFKENGNTMSAMLPLQLHRALASEKVKPGDTMVMLSLGEGLQGGGMLITL